MKRRGLFAALLGVLLPAPAVSAQERCDRVPMRLQPGQVYRFKRLVYPQNVVLRTGPSAFRIGRSQGMTGY